MIDVSQIPMEVKWAMRAAWARRNNSDSPEKIMADLAVAALNAWPGVDDHHEAANWPANILILPLSQEPRDE